MEESMTQNITPDSPRLAPMTVRMVNLFSGGPSFQHHRTATLAIRVISACRGQGYGTEAINWALDWALIYGAQHRVSLYCFSFDERASRLYGKLGFVKEDIRRECVNFARKWYDELNYGMLDSEWEKLKSRTA